MKAARTPLDGAAIFAEKMAGWRRYLTDMEDLRPRFDRAAKALRPLSRLMDIRLSISISGIEVNLEVDSMDDAAPVLDELSEALGIEFDRSKDQAESWGAWREFRCAEAPWIKVDANVKRDAAGCSKVQVGEKVVPIYEIRCEGAASASAPIDDPDIPF